MSVSNSTVETDEAASVIMEAADFQLGTADLAVFVLMLVASVLIGVYSAVRHRRSPTINEFMLGGRSMPPVAVGLSLLGGWISAISILGNATETYYYGTQLTTSLLGFVPAAVVMNYITIPILYGLQMYSISEYLELRYQSAALRKVASLTILLENSIYMGMCLYAPSLALSTFTSLSTFAAMAIMGVIVTFYITIGGVKAVVYTDVLQTIIMFGGVLTVLVICCIDLGGVGEVWAIAEQGDRLEFFNLDTSPYVRHTFWSTVSMGFFVGLSTVAVNQITYQRFASVKSVQISRRLAWFFLAGLWGLWCVFFFSGLVAYATYSTCDPLTSGKIQKADQIIPFLVTDKLGDIPGLPGLFVAAVYGGVLSSVSSTGNSIACIVWQDFLKPRPYFSGLGDSSVMLVIRALSSFTGVVAVALGVLMSKMGNIFNVIFSLTGAIAGPLNGMFFAGILLPWVNAKGVFAGFLVSFSCNMWMVVGKFLKGGGAPSPLPLSVDGCSVSLNTTLEILVSTTLATTSISSTVTTGDQAEEKDIYDISYCYSGMIGLVLTMVVSGVVALATGPTSPENVKSGLVSPTCKLLHSWLWQRWSSCNAKAVAEKESDVVVRMLPPAIGDSHNPQ